MTSARTTCPYCNSQVTTAGSETIGQRLVCPRCGETFVCRTVAEPRAPTSAEESPVPFTAGESIPEAPRRWSNGAVAAVVLGGMVTMLIIALLWAQWTVDVRRAHDWVRGPRRGSFSMPLIVLIGFLVYLTALIVYLIKVQTGPNRPRSLGMRLGARVVTAGLVLVGLENLALILIKTSALLGWTTTVEPTSPQDVPEPVRAVAPAGLAGLAYLPANTNVVGAIHVAEALQEPAGREFLNQFRLADGDLSLAQVEQWTGSKVEEIDHVVMGLPIGDELQIPPPLLLVVQTRRPYSEASIQAHLQTTRQLKQGKKMLYRLPKIRLYRLTFDPVLWCAAPNTLVVGLTAEALDEVPLTPAGGVERLPTAVQNLLKQMGSGTQAWTAGELALWQRIDFLLATLRTAKAVWKLPDFPEEPITALAKVKMFGLWLRLEPGVTLNGRLTCIDDNGAAALEKYLGPSKPGAAPPMLVLGNRRRTEPIARELARTYQRQREGNVITLKAEASAAIVQEALGQ